jgi:preprotein translocase subunit SecG
MFSLAIILIIAASVILVLIVLAQNSKGGGLSSTFGNANQYGGVVQTNKFMEKATWTLAIAVLIFSITASLSINRATVDPKSAIQEQMKELNTNEIPQIPSVEDVNKLQQDQKKEDNKK